MKPSFKRVGAVTGTVAAAAGAMLIASSGQNYASASTIPAGQLQICAQGDYTAYITQRPAPIPGTNMTTRGMSSRAVAPSQCWMQPVNTSGQWARVDVFGIRPDGSQFSLGSQWYNSSVSGLGIGAEGKLSTGPYVWVW